MKASGKKTKQKTLYFKMALLKWSKLLLKKKKKNFNHFS